MIKDWCMLCTPRTASTSLSIMLGLRSHQGKKANPEEHYFGHAPAWWLVRRFGTERWRRMFTFGFVRNPWDRLVSICARINAEQLDDQTLFMDWLQNDCPDTSGRPHYVSKGMAMHRPCSHFILPCRYVGRFETLHRDLIWICRLLEREVPEEVFEERRAHRPYQEMYNAEARRWVEERYVEDIRNFGYTFD